MKQAPIRLCALESQKGLRDLAHIEQLAEKVKWLSPTDLEACPETALVCGLEAREAPERLAALLRKRAEKGFSTILAPRFRAGDLSKVLGAPTAVKIKSGEADQLSWEDGDSFELPAFAVIETAMNAQRWAATEAGCCVLSWRSSTTKGPVVLCTTSLAGPALGADLETQKQLLAKIVTSARALQPSAAEVPQGKDDEESMDPERFLEIAGNEAAAVLLALYAAEKEKEKGREGAGEKNLANFAETRLGMRLCLDLIGKAQAMKDKTPENIAEALTRRGWRAHLRRVETLIEEDAF